MCRQRDEGMWPTKEDEHQKRMASWNPRKQSVSRRELVIVLNASERLRKIRSEHCPLDLATKQLQEDVGGYHLAHEIC